jgi:hypothetical protein
MVLPSFSGVYVFGDSLVDAGNALRLADFYDDWIPFTSLPDGAPTSDRGYFRGRFTDGYTFADLVSNKFLGVVTKPVFPFGYDDPLIGLSWGFVSDPSGRNLNFAYGGAQIRQGGEAVPDLDDQTDAFRDAVDGHASGTALHLLTFGGNDVHDLVPRTGAWTSLSAARSSMQADAREFAEEVRQLIDIGVRHLLITGVPIVGLQPYYNGIADEAQRRAIATEYAHILDELISVELERIRTDYPQANINYVGFDEITDSVFAQLEGLYGEAIYPPNESSIVFLDRLHPRAQLHAMAAGELFDALAGIPAGDVAPPATADLTLKSTIGSRGEVDTLVFALAANTTYTLDMLGVSSGTLGGLGSWQMLADPKLAVWGPNGVFITENDDGGLGLDAHVTFTTSAAGQYTVYLSAVGVTTGTYSLVADSLALQNDIYRVSSASTLVVEGPGGGTDRIYSSVSYKLAAGSSIELLATNSTSGTSALNLTGNDLAQRVVGNAGSNVLNGAGGTDTLTGGAGADTFLFSTPIGNRNVDRITDYNAAEDTIRLDDAVFAGLAVGSLSPGAFAVGPVAADASDRIIYDPVSHRLYFDPDGTGARTAVLFATLSGTDLNLTANDFLVV